MPRRASRGVLVLTGLTLLLLPAWAPADPPAPARSVLRVPFGRSAPSGAGERGKSEDIAPGRQVQSGPGAGRVVAALADAQGVPVSQPLVREVSDYEDFTGRVEAAQTIELRARVSGTLDKIHPQAGRVVEKGELLFEIDPRAYQADLEKAEAEVKRSEARLKRWSTESRRAKSSQATGRIDQAEIDRIESERDEAEASLLAARASRDLTRLKLDSTEVTAPIRGKIGRLLSAGNLVVADATVLATINSSDPMYVDFDVDERTFLSLGRQRREGKAKSELEPGLPVLVGLTAEEGFPRRGRVDSVGTRFDPATGTLRCRAVVPNSDGMLVPGLFARLRLVTGVPSKALLVSERAVVTDQGRSYLWLVGDRDVVERRAVRLGKQHDGLRAVEEGLAEGEWVVVDGLEGMRAGMTVKPERVAMPTPSATPP